MNRLISNAKLTVEPLWSGEQFVESLRIETDHDVFTDDKSRRRAAVVRTDQLEDEFLIGRNVALFELDTSILEVGLGRPARRSAWLRKDDHLLQHGRNG